MKIKLLKPYQMDPAGKVVDFDRGVAELLIMRKIAEPYQPKGKKARESKEHAHEER